MSDESPLVSVMIQPFVKEQLLTAELEDESKPDGAVVFKNVKGEIVYVMTRAAFDFFRYGKPMPSAREGEKK